MDARTHELRQSHDRLAEVYAERLAGHLAQAPAERAVLGLFGELVRGAADSTAGEMLVGDIGCGTGRLVPFLTTLGLSPRGVDLSTEMIRVARREHPGFTFEVGDLRELPFEDASLSGVVCWYSLIFLPREERAAAFAELARVVRPGGYLTAAYKVGGGEARRGGISLGVAFDVYWLDPGQMQRLAEDAGFTVVFRAERPAEPDEYQPQGYLIARRG
ncbi:class I SAM-dependent methyltransferase [Austwickia chelonae]|uniref:class I SAM-dependent methyltransferase n=1 Tax=Austwickia chelonae TaxID=100225 RepID=UPI000E234CF8|nr:class I SAM-dependent methyltransferase [Austwickia chelonae]